MIDKISVEIGDSYYYDGWIGGYPKGGRFYTGMVTVGGYVYYGGGTPWVTLVTEDGETFDETIEDVQESIEHDR